MKILVAVDGSAPSQKAARQTMDLAEKTNAQLVFVHAIGVPAPEPLSSDRISALKLRQAQTLFDEIKRETSQRKIKAEFLVLTARNPAQALVDETNAGYDWIAMGCRGLSGLEKLVLGSVSNHVAQNAACSVLIVK